MQFPLLTAPLSWQGPMHIRYRDSEITIAIIAISILSLSTTVTAIVLVGLCSSDLNLHYNVSTVRGGQAES